MVILDRTRKVLWGRSGNRCAFCRCELVAQATPPDDASVVGEECHIVSGRPEGPRYDASFRGEELDRPSNILLLCRVHHKIIDDQTGKYTVQALHEMKKSHEEWVVSTLSRPEITPVQIRRLGKNVPTYLARVSLGRDFVNLLDGSMALDSHHDEASSAEEANLLASFLQNAMDYLDLLPELDAGDKDKIGFEVTRDLAALEARSFWVFCAREIRVLEGGMGAPSNFPVAIVHVRRPGSPDIIKLKQASFPPKGV